MTDRDQGNLPGLPDLPGEVKDKLGRRRERSRWSYLRREVHVEAHHIATAMRSDSHSCMIAEAIKEQMPEARNVVVDIATIRWTDVKKNRRVVCLTPKAAQEGLVAFDRGLAPVPFAFRIEPIQILQTGEQVKTEGRVKPRLEKVPGVGKVDVPAGAERRTNAVKERGEALKMHGLPANASDTKVIADVVILGGTAPPHHNASRRRTFGIKGFTWDDSNHPGTGG